MPFNLQRQYFLICFVPGNMNKNLQNTLAKTFFFTAAQIAENLKFIFSKIQFNHLFMYLGCAAAVKI